MLAGESNTVKDFNSNLSTAKIMRTVRAVNLFDDQRLPPLLYLGYHSSIALGKPREAHSSHLTRSSRHMGRFSSSEGCTESCPASYQLSTISTPQLWGEGLENFVCHQRVHYGTTMEWTSVRCWWLHTSRRGMIPRKPIWRLTKVINPGQERGSSQGVGGYELVANLYIAWIVSGCDLSNTFFDHF